MHIREDDLSHPDVRSMLAIHLAESGMQNPGGRSHALQLTELRDLSVTFWTVWTEGDLMGFGALKKVSSHHGEIKSVHTAAKHRRKGVSSSLMQHIIAAAKQRGYDRISLETHPTDGYAAARALYERLGFVYCGPFGGYEANPNSVFMSLSL